MKKKERQQLMFCNSRGYYLFCNLRLCSMERISCIYRYLRYNNNISRQFSKILFSQNIVQENFSAAAESDGFSFYIHTKQVSKKCVQY